MTKKVPGRKTSKKKRKKRMRRIKRIALIVLLVLVLLLIILGIVFFFLQRAGKDALLYRDGEVEVTAPELENTQIELEDDGETVVYEGRTYRYNRNLSSILLMGVDREEMNDGNDRIGESGQADCILLAVWDMQSGQITLLSISRDAIVDVNIYDTNGDPYGIENQQICLAYAYGDGKEGSCENVVRSVSRLLYGMPVQSYAAINLSAIDELNDAIGGVEVTVPEDSALNSDVFRAGERILLKGSQAEAFVRSRDTSKVDSNMARMSRQKQYMLAYIQKALQQTKEDVTVPLSLYQVASKNDNMITNISLSKVTYMATQLLKVNFSEENMKSVPGEVTMGEKYAEFHVDDKELYEMILDIFYIPQE